MLKASRDTRRHFAILGATLAFVLGGATLGSVLQRQRGTPAVPDSSAEISAVMRRYRRVSNQLRELASLGGVLLIDVSLEYPGSGVLQHGAAEEVNRERRRAGAACRQAGMST